MLIACDHVLLRSALGGILGNLKSGRGLFGEEATQKFARTALDTVETQLKEVSDEIKAGEGATAVKSSDKAKRMEMEKPSYSPEEKWNIILTGGSEPLELTVRPTMSTEKLLTVWANENGVEARDYQLVVRGGTSWKTGPVDLKSTVGESGIMDGLNVLVERAE